MNREIFTYLEHGVPFGGLDWITGKEIIHKK